MKELSKLIFAGVQELDAFTGSSVYVSFEFWDCYSFSDSELVASPVLFVLLLSIKFVSSLVSC